MLRCSHRLTPAPWTASSTLSLQSTPCPTTSTSSSWTAGWCWWVCPPSHWPCPPHRSSSSVAPSAARSSVASRRHRRCWYAANPCALCPGRVVTYEAYTDNDFTWGCVAQRNRLDAVQCHSADWSVWCCFWYITFSAHWRQFYWILGDADTMCSLFAGLLRQAQHCVGHWGDWCKLHQHRIHTPR